MRSRFLTEDDLKHFQRNGARVRGSAHEHRRSSMAVREPVTGASNTQETGRSPVANPAPSPSRSRRYEYQGQVYKSKTEVRFAMHLDALKHAGLMTSWQYEPVNFRLPGMKNFYKADWLVRDSHGLTFFDTKGWNMSDERSLVKIKTAAGLNRWAVFKQIRWIKGEWIERVIEVR